MSYQSMGSCEPPEVETLLRPDGMTTEIWLRRNIVHDTAEVQAGGDGEPKSYEYWQWQENHLVLPGNLDAGNLDATALWQRAEEEALSADERYRALQARMDEQDAALMELGDMIGGGE